jgi:hypothetical protein
LPHETILPFKLAGIFVYIKNIIIPLSGYLIVIGFIEYKSINSTLAAFVFLAVIGIIGSIVFLSRSFFVLTIIGPILYMLLISRDRSRSAALLMISILVMVGILVFIVPVIQFLRNAKYSGNDAPIILSLFGGFTGFGDALSQLLHLVVGRIVGIRELMGVHEVLPYDIIAPLRVFWGDSDYTQWLTYVVHGFIQDPTGDTAFGYAFGLWGMLYLSGSNVVVFVGTFLFASIIMIFEELFASVGGCLLSLYFSIQLGLWIWGGIDFFLLSRILITALACYFLLKIPLLNYIFIVKFSRKFAPNSNSTS